MERNTRPRKNAKDKHNQLVLEDVVAGAANAPQICWFLTNRNNLLDVLSSGMIRPASRYAKYYRDLGDFCKNAVPLLIRRPASGLVQEIFSSPEVFPVLLEIDLGDFEGEVRAVTEQYEIVSGALRTVDSALALVVDGAIPASCIRSVYFRSATEKDEFVARQYENVHSEIAPIQISSAYFDDPSPLDVSLFLEKLSLIGDAQPPGQPEVFKTEEALGGALLAGAHAVEVWPGLPTDTLIDMLMVSLGLEDVTGAIGLAQDSTSASRWSPLLPLLLRDAEAMEGEKRGKSSLLSEVVDIAQVLLHTPEDMVELLLFAAIVHVLALEEPGSYYNQETLLQINTRFLEKRELLQRNDLDQVVRRYTGIFNQIQSVLRSTADVGEFPVEDFPVAASLLFFLLRSEPRAAFSWYGEQPSQYLDVLANAVTFAGLLYGKALIPIECRPARAFERFADELAVQRINAAHEGLAKRDQPARIELAVKTRKNTTVQSIKSGDITLLQREIEIPLTSLLNSKSKPQLTPKTVESMPDVMPASVAPTTPELSGAQGPGLQVPEKAPETVQSVRLQASQVLERFRLSDLKGGVERDAALYLCQAAHWDECVAHILSLERRKFSLATVNDALKPEFRVYGVQPPVMETSILVERFRRRLATHWENLSEKIRSEVINRFH